MCFRKKVEFNFDNWADKILENFNLEAAAFCFNIYENAKDFSVEFVATASFDEEDDDWACDEIFASREQNNELHFVAKNWEQAFKIVRDAVEKYLISGKHSEKLKSSKAIACGFVDGDLEIIYIKN